MTNTHSVDSLRELNAKLLAEIVELRKENAEIPDLKRKLAEFESEKVELKARLAEALSQAVEESKRRDAEIAELKTRIEELEKCKVDSSAENVRRDVEFAKLKAEVVKLAEGAQARDGNEESKQPAQDISSEVIVNVPSTIIDQCNKGFQRDQVTFPPSCSSDSTEIILPSTSLMSLEESISGERGCVVITPDNSSEVSEFSDSKTVEILQDQQQNKEVRSHKKKEVENIVQDVFDFIVDESDKNHMTKFSITGREENSVALNNIARLYEDA
ncbi:7743_t:CDS:2, partial [Ambispora gerdemannii]